jgi:hypothetical protein
MKTRFLRTNTLIIFSFQLAFIPITGFSLAGGCLLKFLQPSV